MLKIEELLSRLSTHSASTASRNLYHPCSIQHKSVLEPGNQKIMHIKENTIRQTSLGLIIALALTGCTCFLPQKNLTFIKQDLIRYHDTGCYLNSQDRITQSAIRWIDRRSRTAQPSEKLAIVVDVDETSLSNWPNMMDYRFGSNKSVAHAWIREARCPAILPTKRLYDAAVERGIAVIFISGREEALRSFTEKNLAKAGYPKYTRLFLKPNNYCLDSIAPFKTAARRTMENQGYKIIANIGDQWSDLRYGYSERTFKLPNPFYFIP